MGRHLQIMGISSSCVDVKPDSVATTDYQHLLRLLTNPIAMVHDNLRETPLPCLCWLLLEWIRLGEHHLHLPLSGATSTASVSMASSREAMEASCIAMGSAFGDGVVGWCFVDWEEGWCGGFVFRVGGQKNVLKPFWIERL